MKSLKPLVFLCVLAVPLGACSAHSQNGSAKSAAMQTATAKAAPAVRSIAPPVAPPSKPTPTPTPLRASAISRAPSLAPPIPRRTATANSAAIATSVVPDLVPNAAPEIVAVALNRSVASAGQVLDGAVTTSSNVASVEMRIGTYSIPMTKIGVGHFTAAYTVPYLPLFLHKTYTLHIIARNSLGIETTRDLALTIR